MLPACAAVSNAYKICTYLTSAKPRKRKGYKLYRRSCKVETKNPIKRPTRRPKDALRRPGCIYEVAFPGKFSPTRTKAKNINECIQLCMKKEGTYIVILQ